MRFFSIISLVAASVANASAAPSNTFADLFGKAEQVQKLFNFNIMQKAKFTGEDFAKILPNLMKDENIKNLLVNNRVSFSLQGLSVPEKEAEKVIVDAVTGTKALVKLYAKSFVASKTSPGNAEETKKEFHKVIQDLSKNIELSDKAVDVIFGAHPELASITRYTVAAMPSLFDKEGLNYAKLFLTEVHATHPELLAKLSHILNTAQEKYMILPEHQFNNLNAVFASFK